MFDFKAMLTGCILSVGEIGKYVLSRKRPEIIFLAPQHFNRNAYGRNPFFEKLIKCCEKHSISYVVFESPEYNCPQPHDKTTIRLDFLFWFMMVLNKCYGKIYKKDSRKVTSLTARTINAITFGRLKAPCYITMAGLFIEIFQELCSDSTVCDLQHGIIYSGHPGYFSKDGNLSDSLNSPNCRVLVWGERFRDLFLTSCKGHDIQNRIKVLGYPIENTKIQLDQATRDTILFSLEFTSDHSLERLKELKATLEEALNELAKCDRKVKLKHHPRYNNSIDLSDLLEKYKNIEFTTQSLDELARETFLHITWSSTTVFEYASFGIPSFILSDKNSRLALNVYYGQFKYPVLKDSTLSQAIDYLSDSKNYEEVSNEVKGWYGEIYSPFNEDVLLNILSKA